MWLLLPLLFHHASGSYIPHVTVQQIVSTNSSCQNAERINFRILRRTKAAQDDILEQIASLCQGVIEESSRQLCVSETNSAYFRLEKEVKQGFANFLDDLCEIPLPTGQSCQMAESGVANLNNTFFWANENLKGQLKLHCKGSPDPLCSDKVDVAHELMQTSNMALLGYLSFFCKLNPSDAASLSEKSKEEKSAISKQCQTAKKINTRIYRRVNTSEDEAYRQIYEICESIVNETDYNCELQSTGNFRRLQKNIQLGFANLLDDLCEINPPIVENCLTAKDGIVDINKTVTMADKTLQSELKQFCKSSSDAACASKTDVAHEIVRAANKGAAGYLAIFCETQHQSTLVTNKPKTEARPGKNTVLKEFVDRMCFSREPIPVCPKGTHNGKTIWMRSKYLCYSPASEMARNLTKAIQKGDNIKMPYGFDFDENHLVPLTCLEN